MRIAWTAVQQIYDQLDNLDPNSARETFVRDLEDETYRLTDLCSLSVRRHTDSVVSADRHSHYSGSSRSSRSDSRLDASTKAVTMRSKQKYVEIDTAKRAELSKLEAAKDLEIAEAELEVLEREEGECSNSGNKSTRVKGVASPKFLQKMK